MYTLQDTILDIPRERDFVDAMNIFSEQFERTLLERLAIPASYFIDTRELIPPGFPKPVSQSDWSVASDWWEEHGDEVRAKWCRQQAKCPTPTKQS